MKRQQTVAKCWRASAAFLAAFGFGFGGHAGRVLLFFRGWWWYIVGEGGVGVGVAAGGGEGVLPAVGCVGGGGAGAGAGGRVVAIVVLNCSNCSDCCCFPLLFVHLGVRYYSAHVNNLIIRMNTRCNEGWCSRKDNE